MMRDKTHKTIRKSRVNAPEIIALSFLATIVAGTLLLLLPAATVQNGRMAPIDALFTAASATCVTGLIVVDTGSFFTPFGQAVILALMQIGGLGIMSLSTFFLIMIGKKLTLREKIILRDTLGEAKVEGLKVLIKLIIGTTILLELIGALILGLRLNRFYGYPPARAAWTGLFHSVSAFCNAGFSLNRESLMDFGRDWWITATMGSLILLGGIGFVVLFNLSHFYFWRKNRLQRGRIRLHSKLALLTSLVLLVLMFISLTVGEWSNTLRGMPLGEKASRCFFQALTPRTAGFNTLPVEELTPANQWLTMLMMFVGASPSSTGGGIKTSTFAIILAVVYALIVGRERITIWRKTIPREIISRAITIIIIGLGVVFISCFLLLLTESGGISARSGGAGDILFESISAFGTVGLSHGITPRLSVAGKLVIIVTIFIGRVSPLALALIIGRTGRAPVPVAYPEEPVILG